MSDDLPADESTGSFVSTLLSYLHSTVADKLINELIQFVYKKILNVKTDTRSSVFTT